MQSTCSTKCLQPSLFPSASLCVAAPSVPSLLFNFLCVSELCVWVCAHAPAHTNTHIPTTRHRGGSLELATITVCIVAYSLCLTGHTTSALLLFLCTASYIIPFPSANTYAQSVWGGSFHSCKASENLQCVPLPFALYTYYAKAFFSEWFVQNKFLPLQTIHYLQL